MEELLTDLPEDVFGLISSRIGHRDLCNLGSTCHRLRAICNSDKLWIPQCDTLIGDHYVDLPSWRSGMQSHKALFRFLHSVRPLVGIWVHQNPELGNVVYVTWGFLSVVGCRIIPQELGPRGMDCGLLWAPVFEVLGVPDGSLAFFLHGRDRDDYCYPGRFEPAREDSNVLLLEAESFLRQSSPNSPDSPLGFASGFTRQESTGESSSDGEECSRHMQNAGISYGRLSFGDRRRLLELLVTHIRIKVPALAHGPLFSKSKSTTRKELKAMSERHALLLWMYVNGDPCTDSEECPHLYSRVVSTDILHWKLMKTYYSRAASTTEHPRLDAKTYYSGEPSTTEHPSVSAGSQQCSQAAKKKNNFASFVRSKMKQIIGLNNPKDSNASNKATVSNRKLHLDEYLKRSIGVGLRLQASSLKLTLYRAWPIICENRFALYKLPEQKPQAGREYAGLWGGTFGWPPGKPAEDKPGKALFFLLLSYDESEEGRLLIATKILEGTHYVLHPNGSAMFTARVDELSSEVFPWETNRDGSRVDIVGCFHGEGISNGYGFRYPGAKPGDLFIERGGTLAFVWRESKAVLTLQRMDITEMLRKGEKVAPLSPIANFAYLTKANSNVFAGYSGGLQVRNSFGKG